MSGLKMYGTKPKRMYIGGLKAKKAYCMGERVWSAGSIVTYICNGVSYQEEVEDGNTVLSPTTFTPILDRATFLGWSLSPDDTTVQTSLVMSGKPITLYAVFKYTDMTLCNVTVNGESIGGEGTKTQGVNINASLYPTVQIVRTDGSTSDLYGAFLHNTSYRPWNTSYGVIGSCVGGVHSALIDITSYGSIAYVFRVTCNYGYGSASAKLVGLGKTIVG